MNVSPERVSRFETAVLDRIRSLDKLRAFPIRQDRMNAWLNNWDKKTPERYLALHLLNELIYRSDAMVAQGYQSLFNAVIRNMYTERYSLEQINCAEWHSQFSCGGYSSRLRIAPVVVEGVKGGSGDSLVRIAGFNNRYLQALTKESLATGAAGTQNQLIVLVDDVLGSGDQFLRFCEDVDLSGWAKANKVVYAPALAMRTGVERLIGELAEMDIHVEPVEVLSGKAKFFSHEDGAKFRPDPTLSEAEVILTYEKMINQHKLVPTKQSIFGWNNASLCVAFSGGCPNQTLPLMRAAPQSNEWNPLLQKRGGAE